MGPLLGLASSVFIFFKRLLMQATSASSSSGISSSNESLALLLFLPSFLPPEAQKLPPSSESTELVMEKLSLLAPLTCGVSVLDDGLSSLIENEASC